MVHSGNKIIHGDNLEALDSLLLEYEGNVKRIYIEPRYDGGEDRGVLQSRWAQILAIDLPCQMPWREYL